MLYKEQKLYEQARPLFERALAIHQQQLGNELPAVALSMINMGELLIATKQYNGARTLLQSALSIHERTHGAQHLLLPMT